MRWPSATRSDPPGALYVEIDPAVVELIDAELKRRGYGATKRQVIEDALTAYLGNPSADAQERA